MYACNKLLSLKILSHKTSSLSHTMNKMKKENFHNNIKNKYLDPQINMENGGLYIMGNKGST